MFLVTAAKAFHACCKTISSFEVNSMMKALIS